MTKDKYPWEVGMIVACNDARSWGQRIPPSLGEIVRLTKTLVVVKFKTPSGGYELKFKRHNGIHRIDSWTWSDIVPATQEHRDMVQKSKLIYHMKNFNWNSLPLGLLSRIYIEIEEGKVT